MNRTPSKSYGDALLSIGFGYELASLRDRLPELPEGVR